MLRHHLHIVIDNHLHIVIDNQQHMRLKEELLKQGGTEWYHNSGLGHQ